MGMVVARWHFLGEWLKNTFFLQDNHSGMVFQITLTVIGRAKYYAAETCGAEIRIHLVVKSTQQSTFFFTG